MPRPSTPVPNTPKWGPREYSRLRSAKDKGSPGSVWKPMVEYSTQINALTEFCKVLWKEISNIRETKSSRVDMFPFRIYTIPRYLRYTTDTNENFWRTVKVRGGCVLTNEVSTGSIVWGTDMCQYPDDSTYPLPFINKYDIEVPITQSQYWFWVNSLTSSLAGTGSYLLSHGANPTIASIYNPYPWTTFPSASTSYIPIGFVDTNTSGSRNQLIIRQYLRNDILSSSGSSTSTAGMIFVGEWSSTRLYTPQEVVVLRTEPNEGTYICTTSLTGSQVGSPFAPAVGSPYWAQLAGSSRGNWQ